MAKPLRPGLGACIIQAEYHYSDVETTLQIQDSPYPQYFFGYKAYDDSNSGTMIPQAKRKLCKTIGQQLRDLNRNLKSMDAMRLAGGVLTPRQEPLPETIRKVYEQQKTMYDAHSHKVSAYIVSLSQPWLRPIVRGKARVSVDKIYRNRENLAYCKAHSIWLSGPALGRPGKDAQLDKRQNYMDGCAHGSGTALLFGEAVPRSWPDYGWTARNRLPLHCHVHFADESQADSVPTFGFLPTDACIALRGEGFCFCSVDIK